MTDREHLDALVLDVDLRLRAQWFHALEVEEEGLEFDLELVGLLMESAYAQGYCDALTEAVPAQLYKDHGYAVPVRAHG